MPHTNKRPPAVPPPFKPAEFVNVQLDQAQRDSIKANVWTIDSLDNALNDLLADGYKITLRYDERNDCFAAWLIAPTKSENSGYILSGRGSTPHKALKQAAYIHYAVLEKMWGADHGQDRSLIDD